VAVTEVEPWPDHLVCPKCKGKLDSMPDRSFLDCHRCGLRYHVDGGIPVLLLGEAGPLES
jgi:uncharacterized protein YbaR (Trm112 family)